MSEQPIPGTKISIRGTSGSGKSTFALSLGAILDIPTHELDSYFHMPGWIPRPSEEFASIIEKITSQEKWIVDGNYSRVRDLVRSRADTIIWLDYPLPLVMRRLLSRTFRRWYRKELLWGTNRESMWRHFLVPRDSLIWYVIKTHRPRHKEALAASANPANEGKTVLRFQDPREAEAWLEWLRKAQTGSGPR